MPFNVPKKEETPSPVDAAEQGKTRKIQRKVNRQPKMPLPFVELQESDSEIVFTRPPAARGGLRGGQEAQKSQKAGSSKASSDATAEEARRLKVALKEYQDTVTGLVHQFRKDMAQHQAEVRELETSNQLLRQEINQVRNHVHQMTTKGRSSKDEVAQLEGDKQRIQEINGRLEQELQQMAETVAYSDAVLGELREKLEISDAELVALASEKEQLVQQLDGMARSSRSRSSFSPPQTMAHFDCCREGVIGWLFGHGQKAKARMFLFGVLLAVGLVYVVQGVSGGQGRGASSGGCDYEQIQYERLVSEE